MAFVVAVINTELVVVSMLDNVVNSVVDSVVDSVVVGVLMVLGDIIALV